MALLRCDFFSEVLEVGTSFTALLPEPSDAQIGLTGTVPDGEPPLLYLLHGLSDDSTAWVRNTSIERYCAPLGLAVVMPQVQRSFYADEAHGAAFFTFLSQELPEVVGRFLRVSARREDTFVAGLSMGGYGAVKWALHQPERFAAVASLSGVLDLAPMRAEPSRQPLFDRIFEGDLGPGDDLFTLLADTESSRIPPMYVGCGTEDVLLAGGRRFAEAATAAGVEVHTDFRRGVHEWGLWDSMIRDVLAWLPMRR